MPTLSAYFLGMLHSTCAYVFISYPCG